MSTGLINLINYVPDSLILAGTASGCYMYPYAVSVCLFTGMMIAICKKPNFMDRWSKPLLDEYDGEILNSNDFGLNSSSSTSTSDTETELSDQIDFFKEINKLQTEINQLKNEITRVETTNIFGKTDSETDSLFEEVENAKAKQD